MRIDRNAAAVIGDGDEAVRLHLDFDPVGVAGQRLVHRIVDHFGEQMMQRLLVGAADIHAGTAANRLEPLQHLDMFGGVAGFGAAFARRLGAARGPSQSVCARLDLAARRAASNRSGCFDGFFLVADLVIAASGHKDEDESVASEYAMKSPEQ